MKIANANRVDKSLVMPYSMRTIQQAVCAVRSRHLAKPKLLERAGFNAR